MFIPLSVDNIAPVVSCINDVTVSTTTGSTGTSVTWTEPTATDNAGGVTTSRTHTPGSFFGVGTTQVTYTFTDGSGNSASCTFNVNVVASKFIDLHLKGRGWTKSKRSAIECPLHHFGRGLLAFLVAPNSLLKSCSRVELNLTGSDLVVLAHTTHSDLCSSLWWLPHTWIMYTFNGENITKWCKMSKQKC